MANLLSEKIHSDVAFGVQLFDLRIAELQELAVDIVIMLAQAHRRPPDWCGGFGHLPHDAGINVRSRLGLGDHLEKTARMQVWVGQQIALTHHRTGGDPRLLQPFEDFPRLVLPRPGGDVRVEPDALLVVV